MEKVINENKELTSIIQCLENNKALLKLLLLVNSFTAEERKQISSMILKILKE